MASWQGSLRSSDNPTKDLTMGIPKGLAAGKPRVGPKGGATRNALGDISNRTTGGNGTLAYRAVKKASKPFSIAQTEDDSKMEAVRQLPQVQPQMAPSVHDSSVCMEDDDMAMAADPHHTPAPEVDRADINDLHNPKYAAEYVGDIYRHYREVESKFLPAADYMETQTDINAKMRALLVDWLIQVHVKFELLPQTLYLTVNVLDRFLERKVVPRRKLQLVGCAAMLVASKYEEIYAPECSDFVNMSDKAFTVDELLRMESILLNVLGFHLTQPSPYTFLRRYMKVACSTAKTQHFATFLVERSLQEYDMLKFKPSLIAGAALFIAQGLTDDRRTWGSTLMRHSGYAPDDLQDCIEVIKSLYSHNQKNYLQAVKRKYSSSKYMHVSMISLV